MYRATFSCPRHLLEVSGQLGQLHVPAALSPGKSPRYPLDKKLGGPQSRSGRCREVKILDPTWTRTPTPRSSCMWLVDIPTTLSRLLRISGIG
jgi:hypothetical protein